MGIPTIVATSTTVDAKMAGDFMNILGNKISANKDNPDYNIGFAVFEAIQDMKAIYGVFALIYNLYGNGNLKVCFPSA